MYTNILSDILSLESSLPDIYEDYHVGVEVKQMKLCKKKALTIFALNVILVLEGSRLAYRADSQLEDILIPHVLNISELVSLPLIPSEPLLVLKSNRSRVIEQFTRGLEGGFSESKVHSISGQVLGYAYTGENWVGREGHLNISYEVDELSLYCYNIPKDEYTDIIHEKIQEDLKKHRDILRNYGYEVVLSIRSLWDNL